MQHQVTFQAKRNCGLYYALFGGFVWSVSDSKARAFWSIAAAQAEETRQQSIY